MLDESVRMPRGMRAELKGLSSDLAEKVGAHLMMAIQLIDEDPQLAYRHAEAARRRAARLPIAREAVAETAYAAGMYEEALTQYRTMRRMTGSADVIPVMVNCLRALGRFRDALALIAEGEREIEDPSMRVELIIESARVRIEMAQTEEGLRILRREIERPTCRHPRLAQARLLYAYADQLFDQGDHEQAYHFFSLSARLDPDGTTSALDRLDEMDGFVMEFDEEEFADEPDDAEEDDDAFDDTTSLDQAEYGDSEEADSQ